MAFFEFQGDQKQGLHGVHNLHMFPFYINAEVNVFTFACYLFIAL